MFRVTTKKKKDKEMAKILELFMLKVYETTRIPMEILRKPKPPRPY